MRTDPALLERAVALLRAGELVAFPTETVYGLGADALNPAAVMRIFAAKGRPADHPLIVHLPKGALLDNWAVDVPEAARQLASAFWPGPLTLILRRARGVPLAVTGGQDTVGLRMPDHPVALALLDAFGSGIAAPSANRFGRISPTSAEHVREELGDRVSMILDGGACSVGIESTIVDFSGEEPVVLRPGAISTAEIESVLGAKIGGRLRADAPRVSGTLAAHYAPRKPMRVVPSANLRAVLNMHRHQGTTCAVLAHSLPPLADQPHYWRMMPAQAPGYAHDLYAALREADGGAAALIVLEAVPQTAEWVAVNDRLHRAVAGSGGDEEP